MPRREHPARADRGRGQVPAAGDLRVIRPPWDTPYGRMAVLSDDRGAVFAVGSTAEASEA